MPFEDDAQLERHLRSFVPAAPDPLPASRLQRWTWWWLAAAAAALLLAVLHEPPPEAPPPFTLGQVNSMLTSAKPWKSTLDEAGLEPPPVRPAGTHSLLEILSQENPRP